MAHFMGTVQGARGEASQLGGKASGLQVNACSWQGCVSVILYEENGVDMARVSLQLHQNRGTVKELYRGPVGGAK